MNKTSKPEFLTINPKILYFGTPVALITTLDEDGNSNIGPVSSAWALGHNLVLGLGCESKTYQNILQNRECVVNFPSADMYAQIEQIAKLTGLNPVPESKKGQYTFEGDKFRAGNFERIAAHKVSPPAIADCPIQLEGVLHNCFILEAGADGSALIAALQLKVVNVRVHENLISSGDHINPSVWSPLIYNFRHYYALGERMGKNFRAEV